MEVKETANATKDALEYRRVEIKYEGGISQDLVTENHRNLCSELICSICLEIVRNPKLCQNCQNMFCSDCLIKQLSKSKLCPNRCFFKEQEVNLIFKKILHKIELKCMFSSIGCKDIIIYENFNKHIDNCIWGDYKCLSPGCTEIANLDSIKHHVLDCPLKLIGCELCSVQTPKRDYKSHYSQCSVKQMMCEFCKNNYPNLHFKSHVIECDEAELKCKECEKMIKRKSMESHTEVICLRNQVEYWKTKFENEESKNADLSQRLKISTSNCLDKFLRSQTNLVQSESSIQFNISNSQAILNNNGNNNLREGKSIKMN